MEEQKKLLPNKTLDMFKKNDQFSLVALKKMFSPVCSTDSSMKPLMLNLS